MSRTILVTGATGTVGSHLVQELNKTDHKIIQAVTSEDRVGDGKVYVNFGDKESMLKAFEGVDTLFLLFPMVDAMVEYGLNAVEAAKSAGVKTIVRSSGIGADSSSEFMMPRVQGTIDDAIAESGIDYVITLPSSFMQNFVTHLIHDVKNGTLYSPVGNGKMGWVDVRDIAKVNAVILDSPDSYLGRRIDITGSENISYPEALATISRMTGKEIKFVDVPEEAAIQAMKDYGMSEFNIGMLASLNSIVKAGYAEGTTDTVKKITGDDPITFEQFVHDYKEAWS